MTNPESDGPDPALPGRVWIGVTASSAEEAQPYIDALTPWGAEPLLLLPGGLPPEEALERLDALLLAGGADVDPELYGGDPAASEGLDPARDALEMALARGALARDLPVLAICRGLQVLNVAVGGRLIQDLQGHRIDGEDGGWGPTYHRIWIAPGSKLASVLGSGGGVRVNSLHHQGLREAQKSRELVASAYAMDDQTVEALESPYHRFVLGVAFHPERTEEVPKQFQQLFEALVYFAGHRRETQ
jgi:gamma-glutamyl-gamma-aminobutyrate hydrolase PuuD